MTSASGKIRTAAAAGHARPAPPMFMHQFVADIVRKAAVGTVVETGTFYGTTTEALADLGVQVHTVELSSHFHEMAAAKFRDRPNVTCHQGDSADLLFDLAKSVSGSALYFLDARYSGRDTATGKDACPTTEELSAIFDNCDGGEHFILIGDVRFFVGERDFPSIRSLSEFIRYHWPRSEQAVVCDMLLVYPASFSRWADGLGGEFCPL